MRRARSSAVIPLACCLALALLSGCGVKSSPLPPLPPEEQLLQEELDLQKEAKRERQRKAIEERRRQLEAEKAQGAPKPKTGP